jgi:hypothetical protein
MNLPSRSDQPVMPVISVATRLDEEKVTALLTFAFSVDPLVRWTWPDLRQHLAHFPEGASTYGGKALDHGTAYCFEGYQGVALWLPPNVHANEEALTAMIERTVSKARKPDLLTLRWGASTRPSPTGFCL